MPGRLGMNHLVGNVIGEMLLQFGMALKEGQVSLIGDAMKIVDLGDEAVPVLPKDFDRFHGQRAVPHVGMKASLDEPTIGDVGQIFFQIGDHRVGFLRREPLIGKILPSESHLFLLMFGFCATQRVRNVEHLEP